MKINGRVTFICEYCGKEQTMRKSQYNKQKHHFCNKECYVANKITSITHNCDCCGKEYTMKKSVYEKYNSHCCSPKCRVELSKNRCVVRTNKNKTPLIIYNCDFCEKEYFVPRAQFNKSTKHFCSVDCRYKYFVGEKSQNWQGGTSFGKYCNKFNKSCKALNRKKFNNQCFLCGKTEKDNITKSGKNKGKQVSLHVHHIDSDKSQGCNSNWNLVPLCIRCHSRVHGKYIGEYYEWLLSTMLYYREIIFEYNGKIDYRSMI